MRKSRITFDIETTKVKTIVDLLIDQVSNFAISEIAEEANAEPPKENKPRSLEWLKPVAVTVMALMRQKPDKEWHYLDPEISAAMKKHHIGVTSGSSVLSLIATSGRITRVRRGYYKIVSL